MPNTAHERKLTYSLLLAPAPNTAPQLGADVTIRRPEDGATPAELAANMGHGKGIADLLESAGLKGKAPG